MCEDSTLAKCTLDDLLIPCRSTRIPCYLNSFPCSLT